MNSFSIIREILKKLGIFFSIAEQEEEVEPEQELDAYDLADPVDITAKLPGNFYELLVKYYIAII